MLTCVALLDSCKPKSETDTSLTLNLESSEDGTVDFNDLFICVDSIMLENTMQIPMQVVTKIEKHDSKYYVMGNPDTEPLRVFDGDGRYIRSIGAFGRGHGEYTSISDFSVSEQTGKIAILTFPMTINIYDLKGDFIERKTLSDTYCWNVSGIMDGFVFSTNHLPNSDGNQQSLLYTTDDTFSDLKGCVETLPFQVSVPPQVSSVFQTDGKQCYYVDSPTNIVYAYNSEKQGLEKKYGIKFPSPLSPSAYKDIETFNTEAINKDFLLDVVILSNRIIISYIKGRFPMVAVFDKNGKPLLNKRLTSPLPKMFCMDGVTVVVPVLPYEYAKEHKADGHQDRIRFVMYKQKI